MNKYLLTLVCSIAMLISGCAVLDSILIPKDGAVKSDTVMIVDGTVGGLAATGNPLAVPALALSTILSIFAGVYTNMRKKQELVVADDKYNQVRIITEAIIQAVEETAKVKLYDDTGDTVGSVVKAAVEERLRDKEAYVIGKAIISALKESEQAHA
jgi:hypothetical protein